jgi:hypothetical protein
MDVYNTRNIAMFKTLKVYTFKAGLPLFHITRKNLPINDPEENEYLKTLPFGTSIYDLTKPMYFSLDEVHTIYYDTWDLSTKQWASTHLKGYTTQILKLVYSEKEKIKLETYEFLMNF